MGKKKKERVRFIKSDLGVITDTKTNLQWHVGLDEDTTWDKAKVWIDNLTIDGGGWRMPTKEELQGLHEERKGKWSIDSVFDEMRGWWAWSGDIVDLSPAWPVYLGFGGAYWVPVANLRCGTPPVWYDFRSGYEHCNFRWLVDFRRGSECWNFCSASDSKRGFAVRLVQ